jgi:hypothetical protein
MTFRVPWEIVNEGRSINRVLIQTPSRIVSMPWDSAQALQAHLIAAYPTVHPVVDRFRAVGVSRPVELVDPDDRTFVLAVIEAWAAQAGDEGKLPQGIADLRDALRPDAA